MGRIAAIVFLIGIIAGAAGCAKYPAPAVDMWAMGRREPVWKILAGQDVEFTAIATNGAGKVFASRNDGMILEWEVGAKEAKRKIETPDKWIAAMAVSPDGRWLATASGSPAEKSAGVLVLRGGVSQIRIWDLRDGKEAANAKTEIGATARLHFSPDSKFLALLSGGYYVDLAVWELPRLKLTLISNRHAEDVMLATNFETDAAGKMSLIALGRRWEFSGADEKFSLKEQWERVPGVIVNRGRAFFAEQAQWDDRIYPWPVIVIPPGVLEQSLDGGGKRAFYKLPTLLGGVAEEPSLVFSNVAEFRPAGEKGRLVWNTFLIDLKAGQFERLGCEEMERLPTFGLAVEGKEYGACGAWGVGVWYLP